MEVHTLRTNRDIKYNPCIRQAGRSNTIQFGTDGTLDHCKDSLSACMHACMETHHAECTRTILCSNRLNSQDKKDDVVHACVSENYLSVF
jgi:hypothetical protein